MAETANQPQTSPETEPDLEQQVESLLAEVSDAVDQIDTKLRESHAETADRPVTGHSPTKAPAAAPPPEHAPALTPEDLQAALDEAAEEENQPGDDPEPPQTRAPAAGYRGTASLDDELAALASNGLDTDTFEEQTDPGPAPTPDAEQSGQPFDTPTHPTPDSAEDSPRSPAAPQPDSETTTAPGSRGRLRWGWLPHKPDWPESYSRWRPLIIAWRYTAWVVPPFSRLLVRMAARGAVRAEPRARVAVATVAWPLSARDSRVRSAIGWLAVNTLFWSACLWVYILVARSPAAPAPPSPPTSLQTVPHGERHAGLDPAP